MMSRKRPWYAELERYHWFVLMVAALGWLFDTMDQQLFVLARVPAMRDLLTTSAGGAPDGQMITDSGTLATSIFLVGWATGGLAFGVMGDRIGRAKTMMITILVYSLFTGLSAFSVSFWDFALYRFLTGLGVGGEFAVGVALVAEVMPERARPYALGLLQALSAVGNVTAAMISIGFGQLEEAGTVNHAWRAMFLVGSAPALLAVLIRWRLKEPEQWRAVAASDNVQAQLGSYRELLGDPRWRRNAIVGLLLASSGVIGLWGIGFFSADLISSIFRKSFEQQTRQEGEAERDQEFVLLALQAPDLAAAAEPTVRFTDLLSLDAANTDAQDLFEALLTYRDRTGPISPELLLDAPSSEDVEASTNVDPELRARRAEYLQGVAASPAPSAEQFAEHAERIAGRNNQIDGSLTRWRGITLLLQNVAAFLGIYAFSIITHHLGRRPTFAIFFVLAMLSTILVFAFLDDSTAIIFGKRVFTDVLWMIPLMGFCQLALFGGYAIYFPELFPTRLRSTGTSFCYNVGRFAAATGPLMLGQLTSNVFADQLEPMRYAGATMSSVFLLGLLALPFAPETKGQKLPE